MSDYIDELTRGEPNDDRLKYHLLARLEQDCKYFLGFGNRNSLRLWAGNVDDQIDAMKRLHHSFKTKPEWLTLADIEKFETDMSQAYFVRNDDLDFPPEQGVTIQAFASLKEAVADKMASIDAYHGTYAGIETSLVIYEVPRAMVSPSFQVPFTIDATPVPVMQITPMEEEYRKELAAKVIPLHAQKPKQTPVVIVSEQDGVYLGSCMGLGFWSKLDPVGQPSAVTFPSIKAAEDHMSHWDSGRPEGVRFVEVLADEQGFASIAACVQAGLPGWSDSLQSDNSITILGDETELM